MSGNEKVKIEIVTPAKAKMYLERNTNNRHISAKSVAHYSRQMDIGAWKFNGDTIRFLENNVLADGQHRLESIIKTGKPMKCIIVTGLDKDCMSTIDTGRSRKVGDHLRIYGKFEISNYLAVAAACAIVGKFKNGKYIDTRDRLSPSEAISFIKENPDFLKHCNVGGMSDLAKLLTPSIAISTKYLFSKIDRYATEEFFTKLTTGEKLGSTSPILKLRTQLISTRGGKGSRRGSVHQKTYLYYMCAAFDAFLHNRHMDGHFKMMPNALVELPNKPRGG